MIKNILSIFVFDVEVKRFFSMTKDVIIYHRNRFHENIIENIMILKKTLSLKKINRDQHVHVSLNVFNFMIDDEISEDLLNETIEWINENDEFADIDDVHDQIDVDSTSNDENAATNFSTFFDFDFFEISFFVFDFIINSFLSIYFDFHHELFFQFRRKKERKKTSTQYEEKDFSKRKKWWKIIIENDLFWIIIYINYIFHVYMLIK
jgi:hypothetical protein